VPELPDPSRYFKDPNVKRAWDEFHREDDMGAFELEISQGFDWEKFKKDAELSTIKFLIVAMMVGTCVIFIGYILYIGCN
jgi:hypothetical protein